MEYENHYYIICLHYINLVTAVAWVVQLSHAGFGGDQGKGRVPIWGFFFFCWGGVFVLGKTTLGSNFSQYINSVLNLNTMGVK